MRAGERSEAYCAHNRVWALGADVSRGRINEFN